MRRDPRPADVARRERPNLVELTIDPDSLAYRAGFRMAYGLEPRKREQRHVGTLAFRVGQRHGRDFYSVPWEMRERWPVTPAILDRYKRDTSR